MKIRITNCIILFVCCIMFVSCKKDSAGKNEDYYIVSPTGLTTLLGKNWEENKSQLNNKKNYWYTEFSEDAEPAIKAAVSFDGREETKPGVYYKVLLNIKRADNSISLVSTVINDSLTTLAKDEAYNLMLFYNDEAFKPLTDTFKTVGTYGLLDGVEKNTSVNDIINKLQTGYNSFILNISYQTRKRELLDITVTKLSDTDPYAFGFDGFKN